MVVLKKQFDTKGNLVLLAVVEDGVVKSVRRFEADGHELPAELSDFTLASDGTVQSSGMTKTAARAKIPQRTLSEMYAEFKEHDKANRPADNYEKRTDAVSGMKMTEQAYKDLGSAMTELSSFMQTKLNESLKMVQESVKKVQSAKEALGGSRHEEGSKEGTSKQED